MYSILKRKIKKKITYYSALSKNISLASPFLEGVFFTCSPLLAIGEFSKILPV